MHKSDRLRRLATGGREPDTPPFILRAIPNLAPLDEELDHSRGPTTGPVILEYGDYECPFSRQAFRAVERIEHERSEGVRFAFRHFPLVQIHPHAFGAAAAAEAAALQDGFWAMHELLFHRQHALEDDDLRRYAGELGLDIARFDADRMGPEVRRRIRRDVETGLASDEVRATPTLFVDGVVYVGRYDEASLTHALADRPT